MDHLFRAEGADFCHLRLQQQLFHSLNLLVLPSFQLTKSEYGVTPWDAFFVIFVLLGVCFQLFALFYAKNSIWLHTLGNHLFTGVEVDSDHPVRRRKPSEVRAFVFPELEQFHGQSSVADRSFFVPLEVKEPRFLNLRSHSPKLG